MTYAFQAFNIINFIFHARVQAKYPSIITIIVIVLLSILKIFVVMYGKGVYYLAAVYAIEPVLYGIFLFWFYKKICGNPFEWTFKKETAKEMLREGFPLMLSSVFVIIYSRIDQIILKQMIDVAAVGIYDVAVRLSEVWYFIPGIIAGSVFPSIINAQKTNEAMYAKRLIYLTGFLVITSAFVGLVVTVFAKFIIVTIFGGEFASGYTALQFYVWSGVGISIGSVLSQYLIAEKLASTLLYISIIGMVLNVVLNFALIPVMGIAGSALATLISYIVGPVSVMAFKVPRQKILALFKLI
jgi:O-antigen/teichoic acid export membrane protein